MPAIIGGITIFITPWPPSLDWALHISQGALLARFGDNNFLPEGVYCLSSFSTYHTFHYVASVAYRVFGPDGVSRAMMAAIYALYLLATWLLLRIYRADDRLMAPVSIMFFGYNYLMGFASYLLAMPFTLLAIAIAEYGAQRKTWFWAIYLALILVLLSFLHFISFALVLSCTGLRWWLQWAWQNNRWRWPSFVVFAIVTVVGILQYISMNRQLDQNREWWATLRQLYPQVSWSNQEPSLLDKIIQLPLMLLGNENLVGRDAFVAILFFFIFIGLLILGIIYRRNLGISLSSGDWIVALVPLIAYFILRQEIASVMYIHARFATYAVLLMMVFIPPLYAHKWGNRMMYILAAVSLTFSTVNLIYHVEWTRSLRGLHQITAHIPQNSRVLGVLTHHRYAPAIVQTYRGGETRISFTYYRHMPIGDCEPQRQLHTWIISQQPQLFDPKQHLNWDFILFYIPLNPQLRNQFAWLKDPQSPYRPVFQAGSWLLIQRK